MLEARCVKKKDPRTKYRVFLLFLLCDNVAEEHLGLFDNTKNISNDI